MIIEDGLSVSLGNPVDYSVLSHSVNIPQGILSRPNNGGQARKVNR